MAKQWTHICAQGSKAGIKDLNRMGIDIHQSGFFENLLSELDGEKKNALELQGRIPRLERWTTITPPTRDFISVVPIERTPKAPQR